MALARHRDALVSSFGASSSIHANCFENAAHELTSSRRPMPITSRHACSSRIAFIVFLNFLRGTWPSFVCRMWVAESRLFQQGRVRFDYTISWFALSYPARAPSQQWLNSCLTDACACEFLTQANGLPSSSKGAHISTKRSVLIE